MFIEIAEKYIVSERSGAWSAHLAEVQSILPYVISSKHFKYSNCLPAYVYDMQMLEVTHPQVFQKFSEELFAVCQSERAFCGTWTDLALEQTYNRDSPLCLKASHRTKQLVINTSRLCQY